jgi:hypothetical protein
MTPQEYMDLPYAGMAEKELRRRGKWQLTPREKISKAMDALDVLLDDAQETFATIEHEMENME